MVNAIMNSRLAGYISDYALKFLTNSSYDIWINNQCLKIYTPNRINKFRAKTFFTKEPETLEWIDSFETESTLWDIGANVGLYSCYAAKTKNCKVVCFEPSVFNLELLTKNIYINGLADNCTIVPIAISDEINVSKLSMTSTDWGGALSTFKESFGWDGNPIKKTFEYNTLGFTIDKSIEILNLPTPDYIKIDVDGIEHLILKGATNTLKSVKSLLIEINDDFYDQSDQAVRLLTSSGLKMSSKLHSELMNDSPFENTYNQIWSR